jgi:PAS domain S-box-containing protein
METSSLAVESLADEGMRAIMPAGALLSHFSLRVKPIRLKHKYLAVLCLPRANAKRERRPGIQNIATDSSARESIHRTAKDLFTDQQQAIFKHTDGMFAVLMVVQWIAGIAAALWISPRTWAGQDSQTHIHVWPAVALGGAISIFPIVLVLTRPGYTATRYVVAIAQMLMSALLIHLTGGRIETHFHVFGSLAFLSFYRDWRVLVPATAVVAADHIFRGVFWPQSVYGVLAASNWRWLEHAGWVLFENTFLWVAIRRNVSDMWNNAERMAEIKSLNQGLERHTTQVAAANRELKEEISERKRTEDALRLAEEKYRGIFENAVEGIFQSTHEGRFISVNPAMARMYGYDSADEMIAEQTDIGRRHYVEAARRAEFKQLLETQSFVQGFESEVYRKDQSSFRISESVRAVREKDGTLLHYEGTIEDITERNRTENALRESEERLLQSQKMEGIGQLAGGIAHDSNNILTAISGYSDLVLRRLPEDNPLRRNVEQIKKAGERAASLTRQLPAFSRKQILQPKVLNLNAVVPDMDKMLRRLIGEDIDLLTILDPALGNVKADPGQIEQVILNLSVNARDAMPKGGKLTIETANVYLSEEYSRKYVSVRSGHHVMLAVSDNGCGIDEATQKRIFEPFFTTKGTGKGTGLGLSTVYGIVKQSEGSIWVYSEVGKGTTFKVYLPQCDEVVVEEHEESTVDVQLSREGEIVLLVEDEEMVRGIARQVLEMNGYHVLEASHGKEALLLCEQHEGHIDLMVTDVVMPQMGGRELAKCLASSRPETKVLFVSGYTDDAIVHHGVLDKDVNFLQKPFTPDALAHKVREVLSIHRN